MSYPPPPPGAYPGQYQPQQPLRPRRNVLRGCLIAAAALLGVFIVIGAIGAALGGGSTTSTGASGTPPAAAPAASTSTPGTPAATPAAKPPTPKAQVLATFTGSGIESTGRFRIGGSGDWLLKWSYNCASNSGPGNFIVDEDKGGSDFNGANVNELGLRGHGATHVYSDSGSHFLEVNSECNWKVRVIGTP
jgi:hypothetical protein